MDKERWAVWNPSQVYTENLWEKMQSFQVAFPMALSFQESHCKFLGDRLFILIMQVMLLFFKDFIYSFLEEGKGKRKRGRETSMCGHLSRAPNWVHGPQPRYVPWLGIKTATFWFTGSSSIQWDTPAKADLILSLLFCFAYVSVLFSRNNNYACQISTIFHN